MAKGWIMWIAPLALISLFSNGISSSEDFACIAREIEGESVVCVCNEEQCDTITRLNPEPSEYVMYTSSKAGKRFYKSTGPVEIYIPETEEEKSSEESDEDIDKDIDAAYNIPSYLDDDDVEVNAFKLQSDIKSYLTPDPDVPSDLESSILSTLVKKHVLEEKSDPYDEDSSPSPPVTLPPLPDLPDLINLLRRNETTLTVITALRFQYIEGFGGSVTDAAALNWNTLPEKAKQRLIDSYFGPQGLEYNLIRVPIGGSDFSTHPYTLNDLPRDDHTLSNFSLTHEDFSLKLPMIKAIKEVATDEIKVTASTWSPPVWMKTNDNITGFGQLKPDSFQTYADYHLRFLEEYQKHDVSIWAITTTNEPLNGIVPLARFNSLGFAPWQMRTVSKRTAAVAVLFETVLIMPRLEAKYLVENLGPTIRNSTFNKTLILAIDDQRYMLPIYLNGMSKEDPRFMDYMDGIAVHYYGNFVPPMILNLMRRQIPGKIMLSTEACEGAMPWEQNVVIGSWRRAQRYVTNILEDLNNYVVGWIDWNLCLDTTGGPNWANNFVDAPILVNATSGEFIKQPMYYAMGHFSKFIPRGSHVLSVRRRGARIQHMAVIKPEEIYNNRPYRNIVVVAQNRYTRPINVTISVRRDRFIKFEMEPESINTIEIRL